METSDTSGGAGPPPAESQEQDSPKRRDDLVFHELDGEALVYDTRSGAVHRFNAITLFVWNACDGLHTTGDIAHEVTERYAIDSGQALVQVEWVVEQLTKWGLLQDAQAADFSQDEWVGTASPDTCCQEPASRAHGVHPADRGTRRPSAHRPLPSRRELLSGGATKLVFVAPVISTFL